MGEPGAEISVSAANAGFVAGISNGTIDVTGDFNSSPEVYLPASSANQDRHDCTGTFCTNYSEPDDGIYFMVSYQFIVTDDSGTITIPGYNAANIEDQTIGGGSGVIPAKSPAAQLAISQDAPACGALSATATQSGTNRTATIDVLSTATDADYVADDLTNGITFGTGDILIVSAGDSSSVSGGSVTYSPAVPTAGSGATASTSTASYTIPDTALTAGGSDTFTVTIQDQFGAVSVCTVTVTVPALATTTTTSSTTTSSTTTSSTTTTTSSSTSSTSTTGATSTTDPTATTDPTGSTTTTDPTAPTGSTTTAPTSTTIDTDADTDGDGIPDWIEEAVCGSSTCLDTDTDTDGDGIPDWVEFVVGQDTTSTDPNADVDGNGIPDYIEIVTCDEAGCVDSWVDSQDFELCLGASVDVGETVRWTIADIYPVGSKYQLRFYSTPVTLFSGVVPAGSSATVTIPSVAIGSHKMIEVGVDATGMPVVGGCAVVVSPATTTTTGPGQTTTTAAVQAPTTTAKPASVQGATQAAATTTGAKPTVVTGAAVAGIAGFGAALAGLGMALLALGRRPAAR